MADASGPGKPGQLPWWPEVRDRSGDREPLSRAQIVAAAIKLIDAEGLDGFSMRRLGQELGAGATSIYWYVRDKDQLLDLVLDEILAEVDFNDEAGLPWRERAGHLAREFRAVLRRHRRLAAVFGSRLTVGPNTLGGIELLLEILREAGFEGTHLTLAFSAILNFAMGTAIMEARGITGPETEGKTDEEVQALFVGMLATLPEDEYPNLRRFIPESDYDSISEDAQFEYGLARLLDGIEAELAADNASAGGGRAGR
jgi:AcrR family transcriptional regulator